MSWSVHSFKGIVQLTTHAMGIWYFARFEINVMVNRPQASKKWEAIVIVNHLGALPITVLMQRDVTALPKHSGVRIFFINPWKWLVFVVAGLI